jgi:hypothetical protein
VAGYPNEFDVIPLTRLGNQARSILNILRNVLSETERKNWNCLHVPKWANQQAPEFQIETTRTELKCHLPRRKRTGC